LKKSRVLVGARLKAGHDDERVRVGCDDVDTRFISSPSEEARIAVRAEAVRRSDSDAASPESGLHVSADGGGVGLEAFQRTVEPMRGDDHLPHHEEIPSAKRAG
jgi:hypothetical protein